jgi:hypothetical protein
LDEKKRSEVVDFLESFRKASKDGMSFEPRPENNATIKELGLTLADCKDEVLSLTVEDYSSGPTRKEGKSSEAWIFGRQIQHYEVYVKLLIAERHGKSRAWCLSFHFSDHPLHYPLRTGRTKPL